MIPATKTANDWREECDYISTTTLAALRPHGKRHALRNFNQSRACLIRYCEMQRDDAQRHGFYDAATYIQECIDDLTT